MKILVWAGIGFGAVAALGVLFFIAVFLVMVFAPQIAELKVLTKRNFTVLLDGVTVEELPHQLPPLEPDWHPDGGDVPAARGILLTPENALEEGERVFDKDPNRSVLQLDGAGDLPTKIFIGLDIYGRAGDQLGAQIAEFTDAPFNGVGYVGGINEQWFLVGAALKEFAYVETRLWQVRHDTLDLALIDEDPYFTFARPPKTFRPEGFEGVIVAIYHGNVSYGSGGHSSAPAYTILRAYTPEHPEGVNLVRFAFKAGTVVKVDWQDGALLVTGDPSRPVASKKSRLPPRIWKVSLPG